MRRIIIGVACLLCLGAAPVRENLLWKMFPGFPIDDTLNCGVMNAKLFS